MSYTVEATRTAPALVIYLIDISESMQGTLDGTPKIEHVNLSLEKVLRRMVQRSTKGEIISPRYRLAMIAYSDEPLDILGGIQSIDKVARKGKPRLSAAASTNMAAAFELARDILKKELPNLKNCPAPMVCHLTDGLFAGEDPEPIAEEIMGMSNTDGPILIENIYLGQGMTTEPITDIDNWPGIKTMAELSNDYAQKLYRMSSPLPETYANMIQDEGYALEAGSRMLIPGASKQLIELAFVMSGATPAA
jgi:hypothetical protein